MIDLTSLPIVDRSNDDDIRTRIQDEGRAASRLKMPITKCPPYRIEEWRTWWEQGWRWQKEGM